jgi:nucleotidyltransferase substrate binding protein (TIGR01987 family)
MREAFNRGLITHGDDWMDMIRSRNLSTHTYNKNIADEIVSKITANYFDRFVEL